MKVCGIYVIRNLKDGHAYVGSSKDVKSRFKAHKHMLKYGRHHAPRLQRAFDRDGGFDAFEFVLLDEVAADMLLTAEQAWIDKLNCEYNVCKVTGTREGVPQPASVAERLSALFTGRVKTEEHRAKIGAGNKGKVRTEEQKQKAREATLKYFAEHPEAREKNRIRQLGTPSAFKGRTHTEETKAIVAAKAKARHSTPEGRAQLAAMTEKSKLSTVGSVGPMRGKKHSEATRKKMSEANGHRKISVADTERLRALYVEGVRQVELAKTFGISQCRVSGLVKGLVRGYGPMPPPDPDLFD